MLFSMLNGLQRQPECLPHRRVSTMTGTSLALVCLAMTTTGIAYAEDPAHGSKKSARPLDELLPVCASCHGDNGKGINETIPNLGGQHRDYLEYALNAYKSGGRDNAIMKGMVAELTKEEMASLAKHYAKQEEQVYTPSRSEWVGD